MSTISASTTSTTAYKVTADTTGALVFQTGASPTTAMTLSSSQVVTFANPPTATGGGSVSTNTAYGTSALGANTTGSNQAAFGYQAGYTQTTADRNTMVGAQAGYAATNGSANAYFGYQAGYGNTTGYLGVAVGAYALAASSTGYQNTAVGAYALNVATGNYNVSLGKDSGLALTTGSYNTFAGPGAGYAMTTGSKNTIIGAYGGNQGSLDIRTSSNYIVLSDGDGNPRIYNSSGSTTLTHNLTVGTGIILTWSGDFYAYPCDQGSFNTAQAGIKIQKVGSTNRSLNAAGTINASGADYAEYMTKASIDFTVAKGDVVGVNAEGKLTNVFSDAISFVVKSTDPAYVGGDSWGAKSQEKDGPQYTEEELEEQRAWVDRIAFSGQVPVNVIGATAGQYIIPVNDNGAIKGEAVSNPTFEQYQQAVGKVIAIEQDGRARIIVKVA